MNITLQELGLKEYSKSLASDVVKALASIKSSEIKGEGEFEVIATTEGVDRHGEVIKVSGWDYDNYMKNPIMLWGHDYWNINSIIGAVKEVIPEGDKVIVKGVFATTEAGQLARKLYDDGILRTVSVGFIPHDRDGNTITKAELLEISFVSVPANPDAVSIAKMVKLDNMIKTVVPEHDPTLAPEDYEFNETEAVERLREWATENEELDLAKYAEGFTYYNEEAEEYLLPHHDVIDGELVTVWQGVVGAMSILLSEESPVPESEMEAAYEHLKAHYEQFGQEAPEFSQNPPTEEEPEGAPEGGEASKGVCTKCGSCHSQKAGRVLSNKNREKVKGCISALKSLTSDLQDLLDASETEKTVIADNAKSAVQDAQALQKMIEKVIKSSKFVSKNL